MEADLAACRRCSGFLLWTGWGWAHVHNGKYYEAGHKPEPQMTH